MIDSQALNPDNYETPPESDIKVGTDPTNLAVTPDGSQVWVGGLTSGNVSVIDTSDDTIVGSFAVGYGEYPNSGDGDEPTGIVMTTTLGPPRQNPISAVAHSVNPARGHGGITARSAGPGNYRVSFPYVFRG